MTETEDRKLKRLLLSRKKGERVLVRVGDEFAWVSFKGADKGRMHLVFEATAGIHIFREEILQGAAQCPQI